MAGGARRHGVTRNTRRQLYLLGAGLLVVALVGGRWLAVETTERAWDRTFAGGEALIAARTLARVLSALVLLTAIAWITGNLLIVYRAIGSVQMPRRLGDLEIVEAVPRRTLLAVTIILGVILGAFLSLGTGDWWRHAVLAAAPPHFGVTDATNLRRDAGYYVSVMPWLATLQNRSLLFVVGALGIVALLYGVIGSLRIRRARIRASDQARLHLGVLLACLALVIAWGAVLDPAEIVGGLHGTVDQAALSVRVPGADVVAAVAIVTAVISLAWAWRDRPNLILAGWAALVVSLTAGYFVIPGVARASSGPGPESAEVVSRRAALERLAFGLDDVNPDAPPAFPSGEAAARALPLWDPPHVAAAIGAPPIAVALRPPPVAFGADARPVWIVAPTNAPGPVRLAMETDSGLSVISAWGLIRGESTGRALVWRRDVTERLEHLAPFASFGAPAPALRDGALWWVSWGYVSHDNFPLVRSLPWRERDVRFLRAGLVGAVRVGTGETHIWLAPGYDSLTASWARRFEPLIEPAERLPPDLRTQLAYPADAFQVAVAQLVRASGDSAIQATWIVRPREPFQLGAPGGTLWMAVAFESGLLTPKRFVGLGAATVTPRGPELHLWRPPASDPDRLPGELVGSSQLRPGQFRVWPAGSSLITVQAQMYEPVAAQPPPPPPHVAEVYVTLDGRSGHGLTARAALLGGEQIVTDTTLAARWSRVRRLAMQADSALGVGDLETFGSLWRQLMSELAPPHRPR
ncbi:MAG: hypothetical protein AUI09_00470 [Gemmatimonadetes bacterium 13_2_20CM_2_66_5]|nr:MAG: hypothetical protein AUI09_00470 [Gemmatimonadetes bacterium 13_2_20CM_2_66_5]